MKRPQPRGTEAGVEARRAALRILDKVVRSGQTMESAAQGIRLEPGDQALALAIAGETLRRLSWEDARVEGEKVTVSISGAEFDRLEELARDEWPGR